jgi:superfamily II DNA/RNA helicase
MKQFEDLGISDYLLKAIKGMGLTNPTQIQVESIPSILEKKDVIGESATGSGKTLAFGCGIIQHAQPGKGLQSIILTPTRELAEQVKTSLQKLSYHKQLSIISIYGGVAIEPQIRELKKANVVVATPGRLLDHLERKTINLSNVNLVVLDEADRMFDMGFIDDVKQIINACPRKRQTLFFSATITHRINELASRYMANPKKVFATKMVDPKKLRQIYYDIHKSLKLSLLIHLLKQEKSGLVMVFCNSRRVTDFVVDNLRSNKVRAIAIHGGFSQNKRTNTIKLFNDGKVEVLVCTDVAARGLHIDNVSHVYNYDIPKDSNDYVHRIGRTARAGEEGKVVNILCEYDHDNFSRILQEYRDFNIEKVEKPYLERVKANFDTESFRTQRGSFRGRPQRSTYNRGPQRRTYSRGPQRKPYNKPRRSYNR